MSQRFPLAIVLPCLATLLALPSRAETQDDRPYQTVHFDSADGLKITADLYLSHDKSKPFVVLCHQASWSRGEYREIAPKLIALGFNCMAIDQRSGNEVNDVKNETADLANQEGNRSGVCRRRTGHGCRADLRPQKLRPRQVDSMGQRVTARPWPFASPESTRNWSTASWLLRRGVLQKIRKTGQLDSFRRQKKSGCPFSSHPARTNSGTGSRFTRRSRRTTKQNSCPRLRAIMVPVRRGRNLTTARTTGRPRDHS